VQEEINQNAFAAPASLLATQLATREFGQFAASIAERLDASSTNA